METDVAKPDYLPGINQAFMRLSDEYPKKHSGYLANPSLLNFHSNNIKKQINSSQENPGHVFLQDDRIMAYVKLTPSQWHHEHFGIPYVKIHPLFVFTDHPEEIQAIVQSLKPLLDRTSGTVYTLRAHANDTTLSYALTQHGFVHIGSSVRMDQDLMRHRHYTPPNREDSENIDLRDYRPEDLPVLQEIIKSTHNHSHFFNEIRFSVQDSHELFAKWIKKCASGIAEKIIVAENNNEIIGFCSLLSNNALAKYIDKKIGIIDFIVVSEQAQGKGIGQLLLQAAFSWFEGKADILELRTMANNVKAIRFYERNGFQVLTTDHFYHYWT